MEKVLRFDRIIVKGVHRLFSGVHFYLGRCKRQRGCIMNDRGAPTNWNLSFYFHTDMLICTIIFLKSAIFVNMDCPCIIMICS